MNYSYAQWYRWVRAADGGISYGSSASDTFWLGMKTGTTKACPNGLDPDRRMPRDHPGWRDRVAKARAQSEQQAHDLRVRNVANQITRGQVIELVEMIRTWVS